MVYLKIKENTQQAKAFIELAKTMSFIEFVELDKKNKLLSEIESGLKEVKQMQDGKIKKKTLKQMLNGE